MNLSKFSGNLRIAMTDVELTDEFDVLIRVTAGSDPMTVAKQLGVNPSRRSRTLHARLNRDQLVQLSTSPMIEGIALSEAVRPL